MTYWLVAGLGYGDEGKGQTVDALVRKTGASMIVRYNGGAQCAHNVITPGGRHHTFSQFGSGSFVPGVKTFLSRFVLTSPVGMLVEAQELDKVGVRNILSRTSVDPRAVVITPYQKTLNKLQELSRGDNRHGSTGMGIGVAREQHLKYGNSMLLIGDLYDTQKTKEKLEHSRLLCKHKALELKYTFDNPNVEKELKVFANDSLIDWYIRFYKEWCNSGVTVTPSIASYDDSIIFEGAQGILLDEKWGFQPNTTWTDITFNNAETILNENGLTGDTYKIGVLRSYHTRHGAGAFPSEDPSLGALSLMVEKHNKGEEYTGEFRVGNFDLPLTSYALNAIGGVDGLAINHMDIANELKTVGIRISETETIQIQSKEFIPMLTETLETPVIIKGYGPSYRQRIMNLRYKLKKEFVA